jgi:hypothetical protein
MTATISEQTTEAIPAEVAEAFDAFTAAWGQSQPAVVALAVVHLVAAAEAHDVPLCQWGWSCNTPHDITIRERCCGDAVCGVHEDEHDDNCKPFLAQLLEERF